MPWRARAVDIALGLARGLAAAHRRGVLHRDIKPANAMLADDGRGQAARLRAGQARRPGAPLEAPRRAAAGIGGRPWRRRRTWPRTTRGRASLVDASRASLPSADAAAQLVGTPTTWRPSCGAASRRRRAATCTRSASLLYELCAGRAAASRASPLARAARRRRMTRDAPPLPTVAPDVDARLARHRRSLPAARPAGALRLGATRCATRWRTLAARRRARGCPRATRTAACTPSRPSTARSSSAADARSRELVERLRAEPFVSSPATRASASRRCAAPACCRAWPTARSATAR